MKRELGIGRCGLVCALCSENDKCQGCYSDMCPEVSFCANYHCSKEKKINNCYECQENCEKGLLKKIKPKAMNLFIKRYGVETLLDCLERNEKMGIVYHRQGITGDYDDFDDVEKLIEFIRTGKNKLN